MLSLSLIGAFIPTAFFVSITPGMCMTLALTLGMTIGLKRTLWMMVGELIGVGIVVVASALGVAAIMLQYPAVFAVFKYIGGAYLAWLGLQVWRSAGRLAISGEVEGAKTTNADGLAAQGFVTPIAHPKGLAVMTSLLPPFISLQHPISPQLSVLVGIILVTELICMTMYATGGRSLRRFLEKSGNVRILNRVAGTLMIGVGIWLASS